MTQTVIDALVQAFPTLSFQENVTIAPYTYMKVGGPARVFVEATTVDALADLSSFCFTHAIPFIVLGGVSNTVIPDTGLDKVVILNKATHIEIKTSDGSEKVLVVAESGVVTAMVANETMKAGLSGLEYFVGVPGTLGGAVVNNSHFTLHELIGNWIESVEVCTQKGQREVWDKAALHFGYDYSIFHEVQAIVLRVTFALYKGDATAIQEKMVAAAQKRVATQPIGIPSTGCMFRNPKVTEDQINALRTQISIPETAIKTENGVTQIAAGFLIDQAGLKGTTVGGAQVSDKHATYIVNLGTATAADVDALAAIVEEKVNQKFSIFLEREVFFVK